MNDKRLSTLIDKYLKGTSTLAEELLLLDWYNSVESVEDPIVILTEKQKQHLKTKMFNRILDNVDLTPVKEVKRNTSRSIYYYAAASIAAVFFIVYSLFSVNKPVLLSTQPNKEISTKIYFTNTSRRINKHKLPDNSIVWLKPDASISYDKKFINKYRLVSLTGEAFFEIEKDAKHPFLIYSGDVVTRVVGTSFNIKANKRSGSTEVSVVTGKVFVYSPTTKAEKQKSVFLLPEQKVTFVKQNHELIKQTTIESSLKIWDKNSLSFDNAPITEVVSSLNEKFDSKIILADKEIYRYTLKADFTDVNLPTVMELLSKSLNITYEIKGEYIIVSEKTEANL